MRGKILIFSLCFMSIVKVFAQNNEFKSYLKYGMGLIGQTSYQQTGDEQGYLMDWVGFKKGYIHTQIFLSPKLSGRVMLGIHTPEIKVYDFEVKYEFTENFALKAGRFKGAGPRSHFQNSIYDQEFTEIPFSVIEFARDMRISDFRRYGIAVLGKWNFINYNFTWHDGSGLRTTTPSQQSVDTDANRPSNIGFKFTNFDFYLNFTPLKNTEFGGHFGRSSHAGMGRKSITHHSLFLYYQPHKFEFRLDYLAYPDVIFEEGDKPAPDDFSFHPYNTVDKKGYSLLAAYNFHPQLKVALRYEHFDHGPLEKTTSKEYEQLNIYTAGVTYFPVKGNKRNKLVLFYEHFQENNTIEGFNRPNDILALAYQVYLMR